MLRNWLKIAIINYKKNWLSTFINVFGLTLGLAGFMLILLYWNDEASYEQWNPKKENIYFAQTYDKNEGSYGATLSYPIAYYSNEKIPEITDFLLLNGYGHGNKFLSGGKSVYVEEGLQASEHFFKFFPFHLVSGSYKDVLVDLQSAAISSETSVKLFGTTQSAGKSVLINDKNYIVKAVYEIPKGNQIIKPNYVILPENLINNDKKGMEWGNFNYQTLFMLKNGADPDAVAKKIQDQVVYGMRATMQGKEAGVSPEKYLDLYGPNGIAFTRIDRVKMHAKSPLFEYTDFKTIVILFTLSVLIIILSAINFINLKTAQASQRAKEVGVRKAIGSSKFALIIQFFLETFMLCGIAFLLSMALVEVILPYFNKFLDKNIEFNNGLIFTYGAICMLISALISGIMPAIYLANFKPINTLKGNFARSRHGVWLRNIILGLQLMISSSFIIAGMVIYDQINYMINKDLGFSGDQIINVKFLQSSPNSWLKYQRVKNELQKLKGIKEVSTGEASPNNHNWSSSNIDFKDKSINVRHGGMDFNYLKMFGAKLKSGRWLDSKISSDTINHLLVNEAFARKFGWRENEVYDKKFQLGFDDRYPYEVVGVVRDMNIDGFQKEVMPTVYFHFLESEWKRFNIYDLQIKLDKNDISGSIQRIQDFWQKQVEPGYPFTYYFINENFAKTYEKYKKQQTLFTILNAVVLIVALLGLFALSSLLIDQKLKDVAIKKTLGASEKSIVFDLTKKFLWISAIAVIISIPISYYFMNEWLKDFAYRIDMPWFPYVLSFVILLILTFAVVSIKAYRATQVNLVKYLKYE